MPKYVVIWRGLEALMEKGPCKHILDSATSTGVVPCINIRHWELSEESKQHSKAPVFAFYGTRKTVFGELRPYFTHRHLQMPFYFAPYCGVKCYSFNHGLWFEWQQAKA